MIKRHAGWSEFSAPFGPSAPQKPEKEYKDICYKDITTIGKYETIKLSDLQLPNGVKLEDVSVMIVDFSDPGDDDVSFRATFNITTETVVTNTRYAQQLKKYELDHATYQELKRLHNEEIKEWKLWTKQEKDLRLKRQLDNAEKLLRKNGRLK